MKEKAEVRKQKAEGRRQKYDERPPHLPLIIK
jgi:hypothetical protein